MKILFDIGHPAHVHLFRNFISYLINHKHKIHIITRDKDITNKLLDYYNLPYDCISYPAFNNLSRLKELSIRNYKLLKLNHKEKYDLSFGTSVSIGILSLLSKNISLNFNEDDDNIVPLYALLAYPFSTKIINPICLQYSKWKKKRILHNSYHELAYLHPNNFSPDISILKKYNLSPYNYIIIRNSALKAHHDTGAKGIEKEIWHRIFDLIRNDKLIYSFEDKKSHQIDPWDMHHVLSFAKLLISDSQTMTAEAAVLGVPSIRYNSFVGKISYLEELEQRFELTYGYKPGQEKNLIEMLTHLISNKNIKDEWSLKMKKMLTEKIDLNQWTIDFFEKELNK